MGVIRRSHVRAVLKGRCACKAAIYEVADEFVVAYNCYCSNSREMTGSAFLPWGEIEPGRGIPDFWISNREERGVTHVAFAAPDRATVDAFYAAALDAGASDNGPPGLRPELHENYYGPSSTTRPATTSKPSVTYPPRPSGFPRFCDRGTRCDTPGWAHGGVSRSEPMRYTA